MKDRPGLAGSDLGGRFYRHILGIPALIVARIDPYLTLLLLLTIFVLAPLGAPGYFYAAHDGRHGVFYLEMFDRSFRDGAWWPIWAMHHNQGFGYPTFLVQAPLGFYVGEFFVLLGAGYTQAVKLGWTLGFVVSAWGMYRLVLHGSWPGLDASPHRISRPVSVPLAALTAGLLYVYLPYHLLDIYVRAAYNEFLLLAWFPWVLLAMDILLQEGLRPGWPARLTTVALGVAALLLTHVFALVAFTPLLVGFVLLRLAQITRQSQPVLRRSLRTLASLAGLAVAAGLIALGLIAIYLLPLLVEGAYLDQTVYVSNTYDYQRHWVFINQYFSPYWGFGYSDDPQGGNDGMSFQVGVMALLLAIVGVVHLRGRPRPAPGQDRPLRLFLLLATAGLLFSMTGAAAGLWAAVPILGIIQFPWRLLGLSGFTVCALAGLAVADLLPDPLGADGNEPDHAAILGMAMCVILATLPYVQANLVPVEPWREDGRAVMEFERQHPDMLGYTRWVHEPFTMSPLTEQYLAADYNETTGLIRLAVVAGQGQVLSSYSHGSSFGGVVRTESPATVEILVYYFPGWRVMVDGIPVAVQVSDPYGLMQVDIPPGEHRIDARMGSTPVRTLGRVVSGIALLLAAGLWVWGRRQLRVYATPRRKFNHS